MLRILRYLAIFSGFCVLLFCYFIHTVHILYRDKLVKSARPSATVAVKKIVAYSLLKQIENESEEYFCDANFRFGKTVAKTEQWTQIEGTDVYVYSVHFDDRLDPYNFVRIIAMIKGVRNQELFCQMSTENGTYHFAKAVTQTIWTKEWNHQNDSYVYYEPILISCRVPVNSTPVSVAIAAEPCAKVRRNFDVAKTKSDQLNFTICVKPLMFDSDVSARLAQWILINQILGADRMVIYSESVDGKTKRLLDWFDDSSENVKVEAFAPIGEPSSNDFNDDEKIDVQTVWQKRKYEIIAYNHCFYRNLNSRYVIPLDIDEIIVPKRGDNWRDLFESLSDGLKDRFASFSVRNAYYFREFDNKTESEPVFFFRYASRSRLSDKEESGKSFISSGNSLTVFNHYTLRTLKPGIARTYFISSAQVQLNHYRKKCSVAILPECTKYSSSQRYVDPVIHKYKTIFDVKFGNLTDYLKTAGIFLY